MRSGLGLVCQSHLVRVQHSRRDHVLGLLASALVPGPGAVVLQALEVVSRQLGQLQSRAGLGRSCGLDSCLDEIIHILGGGDLEAVLGGLQGSLGNHHAAVVNSEEPVAPPTLEQGLELHEGPVDLHGDCRDVCEGDGAAVTTWRLPSVRLRLKL